VKTDRASARVGMVDLLDPPSFLAMGGSSRSNRGLSLPPLASPRTRMHAWREGADSRTEGSSECPKSPRKAILKSPLRKSIEIPDQSPRRKSIGWRDQTRGFSLMDTRWIQPGDDPVHHEGDRGGQHVTVVDHTPTTVVDHTPTVADPLLQGDEKFGSAFRRPGGQRAKSRGFQSHEDNIFADFVSLWHDAGILAEKRVERRKAHDRGRETSDSLQMGFNQPADGEDLERVHRVDVLDVLGQKIKMLNSGESEVMEHTILVSKQEVNGSTTIFDGRFWDDRERASDALRRDGIVHIVF
jgi:hypothetical protein